jgi:hypothetical protein
MRPLAQPLIGEGKSLDNMACLSHDASLGDGEGQMATLADSGEIVSVGRVFSRGFGVIADNPATVFGIAFIFGAVPSVVLNWLQRDLFASQMDTYQAVGSMALVLGSFFLSLVIQALVQGSLVRATLAFARGERATFGECVSASLSVVVPLVALAVLLGLGVGIGMMFFLVPGIMLFVMWAVASPALVAERTGVFEAFGRSRYLTKGVRWKVFGVEILIFILYYVFMAVFGAITYSVAGFDMNGFVASGGLPISWIITTVITATVVNTVWSTVQTSLYVELRNWKEGLPEQSLAEIFS